jgi:thioredoxin 1
MVHEIMADELDDLIKTKKIVIVDYSAVWCGPCKNLGTLLETKIIPTVEDDPDIAIVKVDIDQNKEFARSLQIMSVPTVMFFFNGKRLVFQTEKGPQDRIVGLFPQMDQILLNVIENLKTMPAEGNISEAAEVPEEACEDVPECEEEHTEEQTSDQPADTESDQ